MIGKWVQSPTPPQKKERGEGAGEGEGEGKTKEGRKGGEREGGRRCISSSLEKVVFIPVLYLASSSAESHCQVGMMHRNFLVSLPHVA